MKDTFTLWAHQDKASGEITWVCNPKQQRKGAGAGMLYGQQVVKLECRIVQPQRQAKRGKHPNDNFGLPAGYKPHNPDNLTREQVGEGFRLLADVEIWEREGYRPNIGKWSVYDRIWREDNEGWMGSAVDYTYRVPINTPLDINPELKTK